MGRGEGRLLSRLPAKALERGEQGGLLPTDICPSSAAHFDDEVASQACRIDLGHGIP